MGKDKKEKLVNDIQGTDCYEDVDTAETTSDEEGDCTNVNQELSALEEELQKVREERDLYLSMAQRLQAEFDNFRKRNEAEASKTYQNTVCETVERFLPVLDNLQRGLETSVDNESTQAQAIYKGMEMVTKQFLDILGKLGIEEIEALDQPFDPTYHDAVMQVEAENEDQRNKVVEVLLKGYKSKDKVIRYSMVKVAI
ncbi:MAG: nucleotide exchange factor GrpE [Clostridiales bacterium]|jgi:molecular chaperone GrpE|nr:nucleotide exchange factor GrpE [Clostridiales bacterium]